MSFDETEVDMQHKIKESGAHGSYRTLGGIINEKDYVSALDRAEKAVTFNDSQRRQAENIAEHAGIVLNTSSDVDPKVKLYAVLRGDDKPENVEYHHAQMSDQRLFAEALRMLGDAEALNKMIVAYPNISF